MGHSTTLPSGPHISPSDRLGLTLFAAVALHALIILGVSFDAEKRSDPSKLPLSMEIVLVHSRSDEAPEDADYLAQANQRGGGTVEEKLRPSSPFANPHLHSQQGNAPQTRPATAPPPKERPQTRPVMSSPAPADLQAQMEQERPQPETPETLTAADLMPPSREIARLSAEISQRQQAYAQKSRHKFITANTKEYAYASYEDGWRIKVERIGNLNYPDEAKRRGLSGSLILDVAINPDGSLNGLKVLRSSGQKVLDDGAIRIVKLAAPFAPFPAKMRRETDVLHIIRTWQFQSDNRLHTMGR